LTHKQPDSENPEQEIKNQLKLLLGKTAFQQYIDFFLQALLRNGSSKIAGINLTDSRSRALFLL